MSLTGDLRGEPLHDMERGLDELNGHLHQHRHAQTARADARQQQPDDPNGDADDGDEEGEEGEGEAQQPPQRPALTIATHALPLSVF